MARESCAISEARAISKTSSSRLSPNAPFPSGTFLPLLSAAKSEAALLMSVAIALLLTLGDSYFAFVNESRSTRSFRLAIVVLNLVGRTQPALGLLLSPKPLGVDSLCTLRFG
jgi:hypothetical protein